MLVPNKIFYKFDFELNKKNLSILRTRMKLRLKLSKIGIRVSMKNINKSRFYFHTF